MRRLQLETFEEANQAFEHADYPAAVAGYSTLIEDGVATGPVLYNLGNSHLQAGDLGHAIAAYRGAQMYWPRHKALSDNLSFARNSSKAMAAPVEVYPILRWLLPWRYLLSPSELRWLFVLINACFLVGCLGQCAAAELHKTTRPLVEPRCPVRPDWKYGCPSRDGADSDWSGVGGVDQGVP